MLSSVIFDFDGIIVNTEPLHYRAFQNILAPLGLGYSWEEYLQKYIGFDDRDAFREVYLSAGRDLSGETLSDLIHRKAGAFNTIISGGVEPYPGVIDLIKSLGTLVPVGLCSGALRCDIDPILAQLNLTSSFAIIVTADDVAASKPDPASYRLAVDQLVAAHPGKGISPSTTFAIEDTPAGITSARGAGLKVLAVTNSYSAEHLADATAIVTTLANVDFRWLNDL